MVRCARRFPRFNIAGGEIPNADKLILNILVRFLLRKNTLVTNKQVIEMLIATDFEDHYLEPSS